VALQVTCALLLLLMLALLLLLPAGDCRWPAETPFSTALCGFCPAPLVSLRTLKADVIAGVCGCARV
jgi:hypothetical protein